MLESLCFQRYRFTLVPRTDVHFNDLIGSTLRGAFGAVFRRTVCVTRQPTCDGCLLRRQCAYGYLFETAEGPSGANSDSQNVPRPFVIEPPLPPRALYREGEEFSFHLTLVGRAMGYFPYFVLVLRELEASGLGSGRKEGKGRFELVGVEALPSEGGPVPLFDRQKGTLQTNDAVRTGREFEERARTLDSRALTVEFQTPVRLVHEKRLVRELEFHLFFRNLLRRISALMRLHCGSALEVDYRSLIAASEGIATIPFRNRWSEHERYSARQRTEVPMGGITGLVRFEGELTPFLPFLAAGEVLHVGKGCVMGLGQYRLIPLPSGGKNDASQEDRGG